MKQIHPIAMMSLKKSFAWKINGNQTKFLDCLNNSCSSGKTETCDYRDQFYLNDASKLKSYTPTPTPVKETDFGKKLYDNKFYNDCFLVEASDQLKELLNPSDGKLTEDKIYLIKREFVYFDGTDYLYIDDAGPNESLTIHFEQKFGLDKWNGTFWKKMYFPEFVRKNKLREGIPYKIVELKTDYYGAPTKEKIHFIRSYRDYGDNENAITYSILQKFMENGETYMKPSLEHENMVKAWHKRHEGGRRVSRNKTFSSIVKNQIIFMIIYSKIIVVVGN